MQSAIDDHFELRRFGIAVDSVVTHAFCAVSFTPSRIVFKSSKSA